MGTEYPYLYPWSAAEARRRVELDRWRESYKLNIACARAIEEAVRQDFDGMHLDPDCAKPVLEQFGFKRVCFVLANTLRKKEYDRRFSQANRAWGKSICVPPDRHHSDSFMVESHSTVLDSFVDEIRQAYQALGLFGPEHCTGSCYDQDFEGKVLVMSPDTLKESCWDPRNQLWLGESGFGCDPDARGQAVYATCLWDGEQTRWNRSDFVGVLDEQFLPDWAQERLQELRTQQEQTDAPTMGGMTME